MTSLEEESWTSWLCDMEPEDYSFINEPNHQDIAPALQEENPQRSFSTEGHYSSTLSNSSEVECSIERPSKALKTCSSNSTFSQKMPASSPCSFILSFNNMKVESSLKLKNKVLNHGKSLPSKNEPKGKKMGSVARSKYHHQDHIIAERMRRERISQQFIALSSLIPGLKKIDKASVLGDAIMYLKQLKEQVEQLEEQNKRKSVESMVVVKKSQLSGNDDVSDTLSNSCDGNSENPSKTNSMSLPEIEARVSKKNVLIRIHCEQHKAVLVNIISEIEKLRLSVINSSSLLFGSSVMDISIIAEMEDEFSISTQELARNLRVGLLQFM